MSFRPTSMIALVLAWLVGALLTAWASLALWFDGPASRSGAGFLAAGFAIAAMAIGLLIRPGRRALGVFAGLFAAVLLWWSAIAPRNDRDWMPDVARPPLAVIHGDVVTIRNVRNFDYRSETDFTEQWDERTYDLRQTVGADLFISYWGSPLIAHTIASWEFADGQHLAISIETRKERGESYDAVRGFFRQYELYYVVADERDVIGVRTKFRGEETYLYRVAMTPERARALLLDYLAEVNRLAEQPEWYNAFTHNCTTTIRRHVQNVTASNAWDWRVLVNGYLDELMYSRATINTGLPFAELKQRSLISPKANAAGGGLDFSGQIREGLPSRPLAAGTPSPRS